VVAVADLAHLSLLQGKLLQSNKLDPPQHLHILLGLQKLVLLQLQLKSRVKAQVFSVRWLVLLRKSASIKGVTNTVDTFMTEV
jgi:hypothetical protein